jgi:cytoskeletal protein CcmA (bactofilin family)
MTTIGPSVLITGEITSGEDITIHGRVKGQLRVQSGALLLAPKADIDADVVGTRITIHGKLAGNVTGSDRLELTPTADVTGRIKAPVVVLQEGATFNGQLETGKR